VIDYPGNVHALARDLRAWYPGWNFAVRELHGGLGIEAWQPGNPGGLYAVITDSLAELRAELDAAKFVVAS